MNKLLTTSSDSRERIRAVAKNFFLHFHSSRIHPYSLRPSFTLGLGVINLSLFLILLISGILLMVYYKPAVGKAYFSILDIDNIVSGGRYLRNMHRWAAHGLVFTAVLHMSRTFFTASYRHGRRMTWNLGIGLLLVILFSSFSGYLLPWDQLGFWAVTIASNIVTSTRELTDAFSVTTYFDPGLIIKKLLLGGTAVTQESLTRFYLLHIVLLPLTFILLTALHFWRIRKKQGLNLPENADAYFDKISEDKGKSNIIKPRTELLSWPVAFWAEISIFMFTLAVLTIFSFYIDAPLKEVANASMPENPAKAPWYFLGVQELVSFSSFGGGVLVPLLVILALILIPYLDRETKHTGVWFSGHLGFRIAIWSSIYAFILILIQMIVITQSGWIRNWFPEIPQSLLIVLNPGMVTAYLFIIFSILVSRRSQSKRLGLISLYTCLLTGYSMFTMIGIWFRGPDWQFIIWPFF
jgi:quinol-cytochrome oxidoreductase complex cytochrome b subunit